MKELSEHDKVNGKITYEDEQVRIVDFPPLYKKEVFILGINKKHIFLLMV